MMPGPLRVNDSDTASISKSNGNSAGPDKVSLPPETAVPLPSGVPIIQTSLLRKIWPPVLLVLLIVAGVLLWWQQNQLLDWARLRGYTPSAEVKQLAEQTTMTAYGERLFYVNHPTVESKTSFNANCPNASKEVAVLGCYRGDRQGIYVYAVTDDRLNGIRQVTAAHEMLHQAYDRLGASEKKQVNAELEAYAQTITDAKLKEKLAAYKKLEPNDLVNEMHSIFGTEVENLPSGLETYYKRYFTNRSQVLAYHAQYQSAFTQRQERITAIDAQLNTLKKQLDADKAEITTREDDLQQQRSQMDSWLSSGQTDKYNAAVPDFNAKVAAYKQLITDTNTRINQYNALVDERNTLTVQEQDLLKAQDSNAASANTH